MPQAESVWFRPLLLNTVSGGWCNLLRVRRSGVLSLTDCHDFRLLGLTFDGGRMVPSAALDGAQLPLAEWLP